MSDPRERSLEDRVARLERLVEDLVGGEARGLDGGALPTEPPSSPAHEPDLRADRGAPSGAESTVRRSDHERHAEAPRPGPGTRDQHDGARPFAAADHASDALAAEGEKWLARVGVGFVVLAFAFLLKLSFDRGWITPGLRLLAGSAAAIVLLAVGLKLEPARRRLAQALLGGGIALLYLVGFAGFQLYGLLPAWLALALMSSATMLSIVLADRQDSPALSLIGVLGGLSTPFLLERVTAGPGAGAAYVALVLVGGGVVQLLRGWVTLLWLLVLGGTVALGGIVMAGPDVVGLPAAAVAVLWLVAVASPTARPAWRPPPKLDPERQLLAARFAVAVGTLSTTALLGSLFDLERFGIGLLLLGLGAVSTAGARVLRQCPPALALAGEAAALTVAAGVALTVWSPLALVLLMGEAAVLLYLSGRGAPPSVESLAHVIAIGVASAFLISAQYAEPGQLLGLREGALERLGVLAALLATAFWAREAAAAYRSAAYVGLLVWLLSELGVRPSGNVLVSVAWAVQGTAALVAATVRGTRGLQVAGLATLGLVAAKLLLVDLAQLDAVVRIVLFLGFGATLLGLGYLVNRPSGRHS